MAEFVMRQSKVQCVWHIQCDVTLFSVFQTSK